MNRAHMVNVLGAIVCLTIAAAARGMAQKLEPGRKLDVAQAARIQAELQRDGWTPADRTGPDFRASLLQPAALLTDTNRARSILASVAIGRDQVKNIGQVARQTADPELRQAAIQSIARVVGEPAQMELIALYRAVPDTAARRIILRSLRPGREDDPAAAVLYQEAANPALASEDRTAIMNSLVRLGLRRFGKQSATAPSSLTSRLPVALRSQFAELYLSSRNGAKTGAELTLPADHPIIPRLDSLKQKSFLDMIRALKQNTIFRKVGSSGGVVSAPTSQVNQPGTYRQVLIMPSGYTAEERGKFFTDVEKMIFNMGNLADPVYTSKYREKLIYIVHWLPGGAMGSSTTNFGAKTYDHPTRTDPGLTLKNPQVIAKVQDLRQSTIPSLDPIGVIVLYNLDVEAIAYASPPTLLRKKFGIARVTRRDIDEHLTRPMHELAHASLNFLDEYIEPALAGQDISDFNILTPAILPDGSWGSLRDAWESLIGNYEIRFSDILADNGSGNISTRKFPATVTSSSPVYTPFKYEFEGGMFFEFGTFHDSGNNVMNNNRIAPSFPRKPDGDRSAQDHSPSQKSVIDHVFGATGTPRPNDRIRNAGPTVEWLPQFGSNVRLLIFDADKNHRWHPTTKYEVQVGWYEFNVFKLDWEFKSMKREFTPSARTVDLSKTIAAGGAGLLRDVLVFFGVQELSEGGFNLAAQTVDELLNLSIPSVVWPTPYQDVSVSLPVPNIYYWRFRTHNGTHWSARTEYSAFSKI